MSTEVPDDLRDEAGEWGLERPRWPGREITSADDLLRDALARQPGDDSTRRAAESLRLARTLGQQLGTVRADFPSEEPVAAAVVADMRRGLDAIRDAALRVPVDEPPPSEVASELVRGADLVNTSLLRFVELLQTLPELDPPERQERLSRLLDIFGERLRARELVSETESARDKARQAAGETGESVLAAHFGRYARVERRSANVLRTISAAVLVAITALAAALLFRSTPEDASTVEELAKLSLTLPLAALAAYLAREASHHRASAQWAAELEVQLMTVEAYVSPLSDELRDRIRAELAQRVFASHAPVMSGQHVEVAPTSLTEATDAVNKLAGAIRGSSGTT